MRAGENKRDGKKREREREYSYEAIGKGNRNYIIGIVEIGKETAV